MEREASDTQESVPEDAGATIVEAPEAERERRALQDPAERDADIARFLAAPENVHPNHYDSYVYALQMAGRSAEAFAWQARAILRRQIDHAFLIPLLIDPGSPRRLNDLRRKDALTGEFEWVRARTGHETQAVIEDAIAWELATPRRYGLFAAARARSADAYDNMLEGPDLEPSPEMQASFEAVRAGVIAQARAWAAREILAEELESEAHAAVAAGRIAREAIEAVPVAARSRITPLHTVKLDCFGSFLAGEALARDARRAALFCPGGPPSYEGDYQIVDLTSGKTLQRAPSPSMAGKFDAFAFADGSDVVLAVLRDSLRDAGAANEPSTRRAPFLTMRADRAPAPLTLPSPPGLTVSHDANTHQVSPSGRYALVHFYGGLVSPSVEAIYDLPARRLIWSQSGSADRRLDRDLLLIDQRGNAPALFSMPDVGGSESSRPVLERLDLVTGARARMDLPANIVRLSDVGRYDERRLIMYNLPPDDLPQTWARADTTLVDSSTLTTIWRGPLAEAPAESYSRPYCGPHGLPAYRTRLMGAGEVIEFDTARPAECATSPDGRMLALLIPPFVHVYRVEPH